jgi:hypothetical protein
MSDDNDNDGPRLMLMPLQLPNSSSGEANILGSQSMVMTVMMMMDADR